MSRRTRSFFTERINASVQPEMYDELHRYMDMRGLDNESQAIRELLRAGLDEKLGSS